MDEAPAAGGQAAPKKNSQAMVVGASSLGTMFEWYDFFLYGSLAGYIGTHFFPESLNDSTRFILALATFAAGFIVRPFGALVFGRVGDVVGRKNTFLVTMIIMGAATFAVGLLPGFDTLGIFAPIILVALRVLQGLAIGGEYGGAAIYIAEHAPSDRRGYATSWLQTTATIGLFISLIIILGVRSFMGAEEFADWGWRIPFLLSIFLLAISIWIRLQLNESPVFQEMKAEAATSKAPWAEAFGKWRNLKLVLIALFGCVAGQAVIWYSGTLYGLYFLQQIMKVDGFTAEWLVALSLLFGAPLFIFFGWLSDKVGRRPLILAGLFFPVFLYFPMFNILAQAANPAMSEAQVSAPVMVHADPAACSFQFDPVGQTKFDSRSCDVAKTFLARAGVNYGNEALSEGAVAFVTVGGQRLEVPAVEDMAEADRAAAVSSFNAEIGEALSSAGYPASAAREEINVFLVVGIIFLTQLFTAMIYGPLAAMLVELFPARVRYTSMSLPYHIGNGWFGGFLPTTAFAIIAMTGNIFSGIWYPVIIAGVTFVVAFFFLPETKGKDIGHAADAARAEE